MAGITNIASSGLNAFQRALEITGNNIANVATHGYSRQSLEFSPRASQRYGSSFIGSGVTAAYVKRSTDEFANQQVRETTTTKTQYDTFYQQSSQVDNLLSLQGTSISASMQNFFNALGQLNEAPDNIGSRNVLLKQSELLVNQFQTMQSRLNEYRTNNTTQLRQAVEQVNMITTNIAEINEQLNTVGRMPELLDKRDELLRELAQYTEVTVIDQGAAGISVGVGNGETLVIGSQKRDLAVASEGNGAKNTEIVIKNDAAVIHITENLHSGMIGGLLDFDEDIIAQASQVLGQMAIGFASEFNQQHRLGMDMNDAIGKDYFTDFNAADLQLARSTSNKNNAGNGILSVEISDIGQTKLSDYELSVTDTATNQVHILRKSDGKITTLNWTNTPPAPPAGKIEIDGLTITVNDVSSLVNDDHFVLSPLRNAASEFNLKITETRDIAFASPVRTQESLNNRGTGNIALGEVFNTNAVQKQFRIEFISPTQFNLINVTDTVTTGPISFTPGENNVIQIPNALTPSYSIILSGKPEAGDQFTASYNTGGVGDNRNGLLLDTIQRKRLFEGGTENVFDRYSGLISLAGSKTNQAKVRTEAADILYQQAVDYWESKSGVNLDEEAANLIRFQQAYQAAGKLLAISNDLIDILYAAMR